MNIAIYLFIATVLALLLLRLVRDIPLKGGGVRQMMGGGSGVIIRAKTVKTVMAVLVSIAVLACGLWVILSSHDDAATEKWAFGAVGTIVGYWLKAD